MHEEQERAAFEHHTEATDESKPLLWSRVFANSISGEQMPAHLEGKYFLQADQKAWLAWMARASLAKPQPVGGALTDAAILHRWDTHVGEPDTKRPLTDADKIDFARAIEREVLATLSAPVAQPGEAVTLRAALEFAEDVMSRTPFSNAPVWGNGMHPNTGIGIIRDALATPIAAQPAAAVPVLYQVRMRPDWQKQWRPWSDCTPETAADYERVPLLHDWHYEVRRLYLAAPAQAAAVPELLAFALHVKKCLVKNGEYAPLISKDVDDVIAKATGAAAATEADDKWNRNELWHSLSKKHGPNAYTVREIVLDYLEATAASSQAAAVPEAVERDALIDVARTALEAYENRFESVYGRYNGPIDDEMKALKAAIVRAALSQGDVSGEGEGA